MNYVAGQIIVWIAVAVLFGFLLGWLMNERKGSRRRGGRKF
jgi:hypothetical protein